MNIGLIGAGAIAKFLLDKINLHSHTSLHITSIFVRNKEKHQSLESKYGVKLFTELDAFLDSEIDIVVEAANIEAVQTLIPTVLKRKDIVLISVGAFAEEKFLSEIQCIIQEYKHEIHLPSGAIGGLDLLQNAQALGAVRSVLLTTRKPANTLTDEKIQESKVIFEGKAVDAIKKYPKNMNISIVLSLAGLGAEKTKIRLIADPHIKKNVHEINILGDFGEATISVSNNPLPENPRTSYLAAMSILGTLTRMNERLRIG